MFPMDSDVTEIGWATTVITPERDRKEWQAYSQSGEAAEDVKKQFANLPIKAIREMVDPLSAENMRFWAPYFIPDIPTWHTDRCCILGDAAHAIPPSGGQGSAQGMEDIGLMALLLSSPAAMQQGIPNVFAHFERVRKARVSTIRMFTERAESTRGPTESAWGWWLKRSIMKNYFKLAGKNGYLKSGSIMDYDVSKDAQMA